MLTVDLAALARGPIATVGAIPVGHAVWQDLGVVWDAPVQMRGRLTESGRGRYFWQAELSTHVVVPCRRCLTAVRVPVVAAIQVLFAEDAGEDDPSVYEIPPRTRELDLSEAVREELILAQPEYVLCAESCRGICAGCGTDLNTGSCRCEPKADARWSALEALKVTPPTDER